MAKTLPKKMECLSASIVVYLRLFRVYFSWLRLLGLDATDGARGQQGGEYAAELASLVFGPQGPGPFFF